MKQSKTSKYSYAAGVIDSDGSISVSVGKQHLKLGYNETFSISIDVGMIDGRVIDFLYGTFGGNVRIQNSNTRFQNGKAYEVVMYHWYIKSHKAADLLKKLIPFLRRKKKQAELCVRLQSRILVGKRKRAKGFRAGFQRISDHEMEIRKSIVRDLKEENHSLKKSLALETKRSGERNLLSKTIVRQPEKDNLVNIA